MKSVTGLSVGTPRVADEGGPELAACEFRCLEVGDVVTPAVSDVGGSATDRLHYSSWLSLLVRLSSRGNTELASPIRSSYSLWVFGSWLLLATFRRTGPGLSTTNGLDRDVEHWLDPDQIGCSARR
ncbi:hypothetical protein U1Q18_000152 [Sarracenia purpurea var. burkii]